MCPNFFSQKGFPHRKVSRPLRPQAALRGGGGDVWRARPQGPCDEGGPASLSSTLMVPCVPLRPRSTDLENWRRQPATVGGAQAWCPQDLTGSAEDGPSPPPAACRVGAQGLMRKPPRAPTCPVKERELVFKGYPWVSGWNLKAAP